MRKSLLLLLIVFLASCSAAEVEPGEKVTKATIKVTKADGSPAQGFVVYAYDESTWDVLGNSTSFADFQSAIDENGIATFANLTTDIGFSSLNNFTQTFRFVVNYKLGDVDKAAVQAVTFSAGDTKTATLVLN